jgi:hypothetical protein
MTNNRIAILGVLLALSLTSAAARGDAPTHDSAVAQALFAEGRRLMAAGDYAAACAKFVDSQSIDPAPGTALNLAACLERVGRLAAAWAAYKNAEAMAKQAGQRARATIASTKAAALEPKLSHLTVRVPPASHTSGLEVRVDGELVGEAEWGMPLPRDGGGHEVVATAAGKTSWKTRIDLAASGQNAEVEVPALASRTASEPAAPPPAPPATTESAAQGTEVPVPAPEPPSRHGSQRTAGLVVGAVGLAGLAFGAVAGLEAGATYSRAKDACHGGTLCPPGSAGPGERDSALHWATASTIGFIAGGAALAAGAVVFFTARKENADAAPAVGVGPASQGTGLSLAGCF